MAPRDGLQALHGERVVPLAKKLALVESAVAAGIDFVEVGSFVSARAVPQMADTLELAKRLAIQPQVEYAALVPNLKYYESFQQSPLTTVALFVSASEAYAQFNLRQSIAESLAAAEQVARAARQDGKKLRAHLSAVFQELDGGDSDVTTVIEVTRRLLEMGCDHVALADTRGTTHPRRTRSVLKTVLSEVAAERLGVHLHDSYGMGIANALVAFECGIRVFDASLGGIGGTPFSRLAKAPGGGGNIATEELVFMLAQMGVETGVCLDTLLAAAKLVVDIVREAGEPPPPSRFLR